MHYLSPGKKARLFAISATIHPTDHTSTDALYVLHPIDGGEWTTMSGV